jgi:hypothetical protein
MDAKCHVGRCHRRSHPRRRIHQHGDYCDFAICGLCTDLHLVLLLPVLLRVRVRLLEFVVSAWNARTLKEELNFLPIVFFSRKNRSAAPYSIEDFDAERSRFPTSVTSGVLSVDEPSTHVDDDDVETAAANHNNVVQQSTINDDNASNDKNDCPSSDRTSTRLTEPDSAHGASPESIDVPQSVQTRSTSKVSNWWRSSRGKISDWRSPIHTAATTATLTNS